MKTTLIIIVFLSGGLHVTAGLTVAQTATVQMFSDADYFYTWAFCPGAPPGTVFDTLYVVAKGFPVSISTLEYKIQYPNRVAWVADDYVSGSVSGNTASGIRHTWTSPIDASNDFLVATVVIVWMCDYCTPPFNTPVCVVPHPDSDLIRATSSVDQSDIYPESLGIRTCMDASGDWLWECWTPPVPTHKTNWGRIKALYMDF